MNAIELIKDLREQSFILKVDGNFLELSPPDKITEELMRRLRQHKPEIIAELKREERSKKVLDILADKPEVQRAIITDLHSDPDNVILTIAIRDHYTFEMAIPKNRYDGFLVLEILDRSPVH